MNLLLYTWFNSYTDDDIDRNLRNAGVNVKRVIDVTAASGDRYDNDAFSEKFEKLLGEGSFDCVMTTNVFPLIARGCHKAGIPYIAWSYDSPPNLSSLEDLDYPTNFIFFFSKDDVQSYRDQGLTNVYHMPLAVDTSKWDAIKPASEQMQVSLVGSLYHSTLPMLMSFMSDEQKEFFKKLSDIQFNTRDRYLLPEFITDGIADEICRTFAAGGKTDLRPSRKQLIYSAASYVTHIDRLLLLKLLSDKTEVDLYTADNEKEVRELLPSVKYHAPVSYAEGMPAVFKASKVNLCPVFRGNVSGIPLRILDVCGCGSLVMSSFCHELAESLEEDKEIVMYRSVGEALEKTLFYITHDDLRAKIAQSGYVKVKERFTYSDRLEKMFKTAGLVT